MINPAILSLAKSKFEELNGPFKHSPSTGWRATYILSLVCKKLDLFGFANPKKDYPGHKYHDFVSEHRFLRKLSNSHVTIALYP